uniref:Uncharacterized protein n=1 Tax=Biomphalaria glabrata TaxID=6526 RepID=A0A2C9KNN2_BIOGL
IEFGDCSLFRNNIEERTALMLSVHHNHTDIVNLLLNNKANINQTNNCAVNALMLAAENGNEEIVKTLIERGADVHMKDTNGCSAYLKAFTKRHLQVIKLLLSNGVDVNEKIINQEKGTVIRNMCTSPQFKEPTSVQQRYV